MAGFSIRAKGNKHAEVLIYEDVGEGWFGGISAKRFGDDLKALGDLQTIDVRINSYGGDVFDGLAIYNTLVQHKAKVTTHVDGVAASIASIIAMAGAEIHIAENAWIMIHDAWGMAVGNAAEMRRQADLLESVSAKLADVYVSRTGQSAAAVRQMMADETWLSAGDAIDKGFASSLAENQRMAAHAALPSHFNFRHAPAALSGQGQPRQAEIVLTAADQEVRDRLKAATDRIRRGREIRDLKTRGAGS